LTVFKLLKCIKLTLNVLLQKSKAALVKKSAANVKEPKRHLFEEDSSSGPESLDAVNVSGLDSMMSKEISPEENAELTNSFSIKQLLCK